MFVRPIWGGSGSVVFDDPTSLTSLVLWLDGSDKTTMDVLPSGAGGEPTDGNGIGLWEDKSGQANHFDQSSANSEPIYHTGLQNSLSGVQAKNTSGPLDWMRSQGGTSCLSQTLNITCFVVGACATGSAFNGIFWSNTDRDANPDSVFLVADTRVLAGTNPYTINRYDGVNEAKGIPAAQIDTAFHQITSSMSAGQAGCRVDGVQGTNAVAATTGAITNDDMFLFCQSAAVVNHTLNFKLGELIIYDRLLSAAEILAAEEWLKAKWATP